jgi:membrane protein DedA with SNARE-associated domain
VSGTVSHLIEQYGTLGVFLSAAAEGETGVLIGGAMARLGKLDWMTITLAAWSAAFLTGELLFFLGRSRRDGPWVQRLTERRAFARALHWIERHPHLFCFFYRFVYGMRVVGPVTISLSSVSGRTFRLFNIVTSLLWALLGVGLGWFIGPRIAGWVAPYLNRETFLLASAAALALLILVVGLRGRRRKRA